MSDIPKKPKSISAIMIVFLCLSIIFSISAYGYGKLNQFKEDNEWYAKNIEIVASQMGYSCLKLPDIKENSISSLELFQLNISPENLNNLTNSTNCLNDANSSCEA